MKSTLLIVLFAACFVYGISGSVFAVEGGSATLETVVVTGEADSGYGSVDIISANKTDIPVLESPLSVQSVSREVMDDQQVLSVKDAVLNVSGVIQNNYNFYDFIQIRGFDNGYAANFRNRSDFILDAFFLACIPAAHDMPAPEHLDE